MESVSDFSFRKLCHSHGASLTFIEMLYADSIVKENKATLDLIDSHDAKIPTGIQLLASKPPILKKALEAISKFPNLSVVDLNFGCPSPAVIKSGSGPALLKRTQRMNELLVILKKQSPHPCGIKIRLGLNNSEKANKVYLRTVEIANSVGLDYLTVHPKTASDLSQAPVDHTALQEIIDHATIPVVGNGFVTDGKSAKKLLNMGCSAVMIARAAVGHPWIFDEIAHYLDNGTLPRKKTVKDYENVWKAYAATAEQYGTKKKFYDYHQKTFQLRMKGDLGYHAPSRILNG